jgi:hypothetical protein
MLAVKKVHSDCVKFFFLLLLVLTLHLHEKGCVPLPLLITHTTQVAGFEPPTHHRLHEAGLGRQSHVGGVLWGVELGGGGGGVAPGAVQIVLQGVEGGGRGWGCGKEGGTPSVHCNRWSITVKDI